MNFECLLLNAKAGNEDAITVILQMYRPFATQVCHYLMVLTLGIGREFVLT